MSNVEFTLVERAPTVEEFHELHEAVGWGSPDADATRRGLEGALYSVCLMRSDEIIGCGRIVGDGGIYFYIQDIVVRPGFQGQGLGTRIMDAIMTWLNANVTPGAVIGLMAARGVAGWYEKYGFQRRPDAAPGMMRIW